MEIQDHSPLIARLRELDPIAECRRRGHDLVHALNERLPHVLALARDHA